MARRSSHKPTIRILLLGAPNVGKCSLESRFTTHQYPPQYNTHLVNSRRYLTLSSSPADAAPTSPPPPPPAAAARPRPLSTSSTFSNPGSAPSTPTITARPSAPTPTQQQPPPPPPKLTLNTAVLVPDPNNDWFHPPTPSLTPITPGSDTSPGRDDSYLVEIHNHPGLASPSSRAAVLARGAFDAVVLVYDVSSRASFSAISALCEEIPLRSNSPTTRSSSGDGTGEVVIALVGNKCDIPSSPTSASASGFDPYSPRLNTKTAERQRAEIEARGLVHPLFRAPAAPDDDDDRPPTPPSAIDKWIAMDTDDDSTRVASRESAAPPPPQPLRREVSRFEGELLARSLLLSVPFFETSARTGENVDAAFEAVVREALWQMGCGVVEDKAKGSSVLRKGRERGGGWVEEAVVSPISPLPPVLRLPDFGRSGFGEGKTSEEGVEMVAVESPGKVSSAPARKRRRESVIGGFLKKIFRRSAVTA